MTRSKVRMEEFDHLMRRIFGPCRKVTMCEREDRHSGKCRIRKVAA